MPLDPVNSQTARIFAEYKAAMAAVGQQNVSVVSDLEALYSKVLAVSAGSEFEHFVTMTLLAAVKLRSNPDVFSDYLINNLITRKYFQWFDVDKPNFNKIWRAFIPDFGNVISAEMEENADAFDKIGDFMTVNQERNRLVHQNFAAASPDFTADEIFSKFSSACVAANLIETLLAKHSP